MLIPRPLATVSECSVTRRESVVHASLDPMTPARRHDVADADMSIALQLSSSVTLTFDPFVPSLHTNRVNEFAHICFSDYFQAIFDFFSARHIALSICLLKRSRDT